MRTFSVYISTQLVGNYYWTRPIMFVPCCLHHTHYLEVEMLVCKSCAAVSLWLGPFSLLPVWVWQQAQTGKYSRNLSQAAEYSSSLGHHHPTTLQCWFLLTLSDCAKWLAVWVGGVRDEGLEKSGIWNETVGWAWTLLWRTPWLIGLLQERCAPRWLGKSCLVTDKCAPLKVES